MNLTGRVIPRELNQGLKSKIRKWDIFYGIVHSLAISGIVTALGLVAYIVVVL